MERSLAHFLALILLLQGTPKLVAQMSNQLVTADLLFEQGATHPERGVSGRAGSEPSMESAVHHLVIMRYDGGLCGVC